MRYSKYFPRPIIIVLWSGMLAYVGAGLLFEGKYGVFGYVIGLVLIAVFIYVILHYKIYLRDRRNCPKCGNPMKTVIWKGNVFQGCSAYPKCRYTKSMP